MKLFLQFLAVATLCLLSWHQAELHREWLPVSVAVAFAGVMAAYLTVRSRRLGYWLSVFLGVSYATEVIVRVPDLTPASPLLAWAFLLTGSGSALAWRSRPRGPSKTEYERHAQF